MTRRRTSNRTREARRPEPRTRGQSEVLGVILLLAITITGTGLVVAFGSSALDDSKRASELDSAEHAMTQLDSKISLVGIGESNSQTLSLGFDAVTRVENESGWMRITIDDSAGGETEVMNQTLGSVVYENGGSTVAYQGGGVWRRTGDGTTMVSPPEVHYRDTTLTLPLVVTAGRGPLDSRTVVRKNGTGEPKFPLAEDGKHNPLSGAEVDLTVQSEYYEAWGRFFEQRTGGEVDVDHGKRTVTLTLVTPTERPPISGGIISTASGDKLELDNKAYVDSYNSSDGVYSDSSGESGTIVTAGSVELDNKARIHANLVSGGGKVSLKKKHTEITGNLSYKSLGEMRGTVGGWQASNGSAPAVEPVGGLIETKLDEIESDNDNADDPDDDITPDGHLRDGRTTYDLTAGNYYLNEIDLSGKTLVLDTTDGDITLVVERDIQLDGSNVDVEGGNEVRVYMDGEQFSMDSHSTVSVPDQKSSRFWLYGPPGTEVQFDTHSHFEGVVYAPDSESRTGEITIQTQSRVFGALIGTVTGMDNSASIHFDEALQRVEDPTDAGDDATPRVTYMHVSVNRVNVTSV